MLPLFMQPHALHPSIGKAVPARDSLIDARQAAACNLELHDHVGSIWNPNFGYLHLSVQPPYMASLLMPSVKSSDRLRFRHVLNTRVQMKLFELGGLNYSLKSATNGGTSLVQISYMQSTPAR